MKEETILYPLKLGISQDFKIVGVAFDFDPAKLNAAKFTLAWDGAKTEIQAEALDAAYNVKDVLDESLVVQTKTLIDYSEAQLKRIGTPYEEGTRVRHPIFGCGTVVSVNKKAGCYSIAFDSMQTERSIRFGTELGEVE